MIFSFERRNLGESKLRLDKIKRNLYRYTSEKYPKNPDSFAAVSEAFNDSHIFNEYGLNMRRNKPFYIGTVTELMYQFTLFASMDVISMIKLYINPEDRKYMMDGTFSIKPTGPYYQVLVIYIEFENDVSFHVHLSQIHVKK